MWRIRQSPCPFFSTLSTITAWLELLPRPGVQSSESTAPLVILGTQFRTSGGHHWKSPNITTWLIIPRGVRVDLEDGRRRKYPAPVCLRSHQRSSSKRRKGAQFDYLPQIYFDQPSHYQLHGLHGISRAHLRASLNISVVYNTRILRGALIRSPWCREASVVPLIEVGIP